jgi:hypothetical protein
MSIFVFTLYIGWVFCVGSDITTNVLRLTYFYISLLFFSRRRPDDGLVKYSETCSPGNLFDNISCVRTKNILLFLYIEL